MFGFMQEKKKPVRLIEPFTKDDARKIAGQFVGTGSIYQVFTFGEMARNKRSINISLIFAVQDEVVFNRFVDLVRLFRHSDTKQEELDSQYRTAAFQMIWGSSNPKWSQCLSHRSESLLLFMDVVVLPLSWRNRIEELEMKVGDKIPESLAQLKLDASVLATHS